MKFDIKRKVKDRLRQIDRILKSYCSFLLNRILPKSRIVFFESHLGLTIGCSPLAIFEALKREDKDVICIWSYADEKLKLPEDCKGVRRYSWSYLYYLSRAKVWIQNSEFPFYQSPSRKVLYINTQHGTPLKKMMSDIHYRKKSSLAGSQRNGVRWDYLITANSYSTAIYQKLCHQECKILEIGYPRNDLLFRGGIEVEEIKRKYKFPVGDKPIVLYAPTYREYAEEIDFYALIMQLPKSVRSNFIFLVRSHHLNNLPEGGRDEDVIDVSSAEFDIQKLYLVADILLTDYSSAMFDFLYLSKPIILFPFDYELYAQHRGLYFDIREEKIGPIAFDLKQLAEELESLDVVRNTDFKTARQKFCHHIDGDASERISRAIIQFLKGTKKEELVI